MKLEQRKNDRVVLSLEVNYKVFQLKNLEKDVQDSTLDLKGAIQNLSLGGVQVVSDRLFQAGEILEMEMQIPGSGPVRTVAKVAWCKPDPASKSGEFLSGIQFIPVYEEDLRKVRDYFSSGETR